MTEQRTYLDHNATAPLRPEARSAMLAALDVAGNPSSVHAEGRQARSIVENAREQVARLVGARPSQVVFTSGATEANAWLLRAGWDVVFASGIEHDSVLASIRAANARLVDLPVGRDGVVAAGAISEALDGAADGRRLVTLQLANNETGAIQPVAEAAELAHAHDVLFHCDAVQGAGKIAIDFTALGADSMSLSAHKIGGPKGIGALVLRDGFEPTPLIAGGGQERRRRAGTENVAGIAGFGAAAEAALRDLADMPRLAGLRDRLEREALAMVPQAVVVAQNTPRLANTTCIAAPGMSAETMVIKLDLAGVAVSAGAACSSGKVGSSAVLAAMGLSEHIARSAIRVSLGWSSADRDVDTFLAAWTAIAGAQRPAAAA